LTSTNRAIAVGRAAFGELAHRDCPEAVADEHHRSCRAVHGGGDDVDVLVVAIRQGPVASGQVDGLHAVAGIAQRPDDAVPTPAA
jgi:hypothetical protein